MQTLGQSATALGAAVRQPDPVCRRGAQSSDRPRQRVGGSRSRRCSRRCRSPSGSTSCGTAAKPTAKSLDSADREPRQHRRDPAADGRPVQRRRGRQRLQQPGPLRPRRAAGLELHDLRHHSRSRAARRTSSPRRSAGTAARGDRRAADGRAGPTSPRRRIRGATGRPATATGARPRGVQQGRRTSPPASSRGPCGTPNARRSSEPEGPAGLPDRGPQVNRRTPGSGITSSPILIGALTVLVTIVAVTLAYNATNGLPFVPRYDLHVQISNAERADARDRRPDRRRAGRDRLERHPGAAAGRARDRAAEPEHVSERQATRRSTRASRSG